jgi:hypothetical protein
MGTVRVGDVGPSDWPDIASPQPRERWSSEVGSAVANVVVVVVGVVVEVLAVVSDVVEVAAELPVARFAEDSRTDPASTRASKVVTSTNRNGQWCWGGGTGEVDISSHRNIGESQLPNVSSK